MVKDELREEEAAEEVRPRRSPRSTVVRPRRSPRSTVMRPWRSPRSTVVITRVFERF
jgi:hypothetical protein